MYVKLAELWEKNHYGQEEAAMKSLKRAWFNKPSVFKKQVNKEHSSFIAKVNEVLVQAESDLA